MRVERFAHRYLPALLVVILALLAVVRSAAGTRLDGFTIDEPWHAVAGLAYERSGDYSLNPEHPPLVKRFVARFLPSSFDLPATPVLREKPDERQFVEDAMYVRNDADAMQERTRAAMWSFHALLFIAIGLLLWQSLGAPWALGTLAFLAVEPTVAAHLPLVMTDLPVAATLLLSAAALGALLHEWRWRAVLASALAMGLALGSKHSALPGLAGLALFAAAAWAWQARGQAMRVNLVRLAKLGCAGALAVGLLWAQYDFRFAPRPDGSDAFNRPLAGKLQDLRGETARSAIAFADAHRVLPRAYLWGLADTVRVGVDGRGDPGTFLWGEFRSGSPPWYAWPSLVSSKVPLPLLAMSLLGAVALWRLPMSPNARLTLGTVLAMALGHACALASSGSIYAGVRHALPVVLALAVLAGALLQRLWQSPRSLARSLAVAPLLLAAAMTLPEPRLWEYHNELAGGTEEAYKYFENEGLDLGQRSREIIAFGEHEVAPTGLPMYRNYAVSDAQAKQLRFPLRRRVESIEDDNVAGIYEGFVATTVHAREPAPHYSYDPAEMLAGLQPVIRIGNAEIYRGRQVQPKSRLGAMYGRIMKYVYTENGSDWKLVAQRAQEIVDVFPQHTPAAIELGNAWLRLGDRDRARSSYAIPLDQTMLPVEAGTRAELVAQIARIDAVPALDAIAPLRNPAME